MLRVATSLSPSSPGSAVSGQISENPRRRFQEEVLASEPISNLPENPASCRVRVTAAVHAGFAFKKKEDPRRLEPCESGPAGCLNCLAARKLVRRFGYTGTDSRADLFETGAGGGKTAILVPCSAFNGSGPGPAV